MGLSKADNYYLKAKSAINDNWCSDWEEASEAINYALSYEPNHIPSLVLMGEIQGNFLKDYELAFAYFERAMVENPRYAGTYPSYISFLIKIEAFEKAKKLIEFAGTLKESEKTVLLVLEATILERKQQYKEAIKQLKKAKQHSYSEDSMTDVEASIKRIQKKLPKKKKSENSKKKKQKK